MVETGRPEVKDIPWFNVFGKFVPYNLAKEIMNKIHFATHDQSEEIYFYKDGIYEPNGEITLKKEIQNMLQEYVKTSRVNETIEAIKRDTYIPHEEFGEPKNIIAVKNGLLDIYTKELKPFTPKIIQLTKLQIKYDKKTTPTKTIKFLEQIINKEDIPIIQELFGYCLLRDYPIAKAFMMLGGGHNGKSTLLNLLRKFIGDENIATPSLQTLLDNQFAAIELYQKLANIHADLSKKELVNTGTFKMLTGKDLMRGEKKYQNSITFFNFAKLIYSANQLPKTKDRTIAFFRRWEIIDFPNEFPEDDPNTDPYILEKITTPEELSGILNWSLEGLHRLLKNGKFATSKNREKIQTQWIMQTDSLRAFCDFALEKNENGLIDKKDLWEVAYNAFCERHEIYTVKEAVMTRDLPTIIRYTKKIRPVINNERPYCWENITFTEQFVKEFPIEVQNTKIYKKNGEDENYKQKSLTDIIEEKQKNSGTTLDVQDVHGFTPKLYTKIEKVKKLFDLTMDEADGEYESKSKDVDKIVSDGKFPVCFDCQKNISDIGQLCNLDGHIYCRECRNKILW